MEFRPDPIEERSDAHHRRIAARIRREPHLIALAKERNERWIVRDGAVPLGVRLEWRAALRLLDVEQLAGFLESGTPRARRMRVSSPFLGIDEA